MSDLSIFETPRSPIYNKRDGYNNFVILVYEDVERFYISVDNIFTVQVL